MVTELTSIIRLWIFWDATPDKSRAATPDDIKGLEGHNEIQIDEVDTIGNEGKGTRPEQWWYFGYL